VLILGAGLDTRAARKAAPGVTYFEIDDAATLALKQACYERHALDVDVRFIPGNYVRDGLIDLLDANGFDFDLPTYVIWEGNVMYLPLEHDRMILEELGRCVPRFRVSFDYMAEAVITHATGDAGISTLVESFAAMGAPWVSGIGDVDAFAHSLGLRVVDNFTTAALHRRYWPGRVVASPIFDFYSVCTVES
jgi:methyltransferase (TIGR00027 family)